MEENREIVDYIKDRLQAGSKEDEIKKALLEKGWNKNLVEKYFQVAMSELGRTTKISDSPTTSDEAVNEGSTKRPGQKEQGDFVVQNINGQQAGQISEGEGVKLKGPIELLTISWQEFKGYWKTLLFISLTPTFVLVLFVLLAGSSVAILGGFGDGILTVLIIIFIILVSILMLIINFWGQAALLFGITFSEERYGWKDVYGSTWGKIRSYFRILFLGALISIGGFFLFFVPGLIISLGFVFAPFVLFKEDIRGLNALIKSRDYVKGYWLSVFGRFFVLGLILIIVYVPTTFINSLEIEGVIGGLVSLSATVINFVITPIYWLYAKNIYKNLRDIKGKFKSDFSKRRRRKYALLGIFGLLAVLLGIIMFIVLAVDPAEHVEKARDSEKLSEATMINYALKGYMIENGSYPEELSDLVPEYVTDLPKDASVGESYIEYTNLGDNYLLCVDYENYDDECYGSEDSLLQPRKNGSPRSI